MAQTVKFMFLNVAHRPTVSKTGARPKETDPRLAEEKKEKKLGKTSWWIKSTK